MADSGEKKVRNRDKEKHRLLAATRDEILMTCTRCGPLKRDQVYRSGRHCIKCSRERNKNKKKNVIKAPINPTRNEVIRRIRIEDNIPRNEVPEWLIKIKEPQLKLKRMLRKR